MDRKGRKIMLKSTKKRFLRWWSKPVRPLLLLIPTIIVSMLLVAGSTLAWFISTDSKENPFAGGKQRFSIDLVDEFKTPDAPVYRGAKFDKKVGAVNTGDVPGFVRLLVQPVIFANDSSGATPLPAEIGKEVLLLDLDTTKWKLGEDGYYYYMGVLMPGEEAPPLFTKAQISGSLGPEYDNATLKIEVKAEGVDYYPWHYRDAWWDYNDPWWYDLTGPTAPLASGNIGDIELALRDLAQ